MDTIIDALSNRLAHRLRLERDSRGWSLADLAEGSGDRLSRAADQQVWRDPETGYLRRQVFSRPDNPIEIVRVEMPAKQRVTLPASSYAHIRQTLWVLSGALVIIEAGERHELGTGDCLGFGPPA